MAEQSTTPLRVDARCLCGNVRYRVEGDSFGFIYCHCSRCRKHSGAIVKPFAIFQGGRVTWLSGRDTVQTFQGDITVRGFCPRCGAGTPPAVDEVNAVACGSVLELPPPIATWHLFTSTKMPWYRIPPGVEQWPTVSPEFAGQAPNLPELHRPIEPGRITGSCLCGAVAYVARNPQRMLNCHCSRCRLSRTAAHATNLFVARSDFDWRSGRELVQDFALPGAARFGAAFCSRCGSLVPRAGRDRVNIPAGGLDTLPDITPEAHIFTGSMAPWFEITDDLPRWSERMPTSR